VLNLKLAYSPIVLYEPIISWLSIFWWQFCGPHIVECGSFYHCVTYKLIPLAYASCVQSWTTKFCFFPYMKSLSFALFMKWVKYLRYRKVKPLYTSLFGDLMLFIYIFSFWITDSNEFELFSSNVTFPQKLWWVYIIIACTTLLCKAHCHVYLFALIKARDLI
jgi:hypothetical protein